MFATLGRAMLECGEPTGSICLMEHEYNMGAVWACLLAGYLPCLQPAPSAQQAHKEGYAAHIKQLFESPGPTEYLCEDDHPATSLCRLHPCEPDEEDCCRKTMSVSFVVPSIETEKLLIKICASIFNLVKSEASVSDNFFEIGGTSLDAIWLKCEGEKHFDLPDIPTIQILKHLDTTIVPLPATGYNTLIFFVYPGVAEVLIFVNLAKYFQNERPFYAFRARGFGSGHPPFTSMDEMISYYVAAAKRIQATVLYAIAGYSYGVVVAFEIAKQLEAMGEEVRCFAPINIPPNISDRMRGLDWTAASLNLSAFLG
ncbi:Alpha/Beta hydrolase protein [Suillus discolor]|uniref:Alpha/Beta hydrolase protein n=1 Tax=Suillus discolor TaxID=1912936 RepID=A0A9P7F0J2_9AGAM|nr:Alpha/Beta hydrolase protein [Suillus discolor]KAG2099299.1 Alpha/Beta hydrolase protein [Suillus discolor]